MNTSFRRPAEIALRVAVAAVCLAGIWQSWKLARADSLFRKDTESSLRSAIALAPDAWTYYMRLSQIDRKDARELLATSLRLDHYNAPADVELALKVEGDGDIARAEKLLLDAYSVDHTYMPRWSLANFYFRQDNMPAFWTWARSAAAMPPEDLGPLFQLCWHVTEDPKKITSELLNNNPDMLRQYLYFLLQKGQRNATVDVAPRLVATGGTALDRRLVFWTLNQLIDDNDAPDATGLWRTLQQHGWVATDSGLPYDALFARESSPASFDWNLPEYDGLHSWPGGSGLEVEFSGTQPEQVTVAEQVVPLGPGNYNLNFNYHSDQIQPGTGIQWFVLDNHGQTVLAQSGDLASDNGTAVNLPFTVPAGSSFVRLRLAYQRQVGTPRITGTLVVSSIHIQPHS